jgi:hypothetical protein
LLSRYRGKAAALGSEARKAEIVDKNALHTLATALQAMKVPPPDAMFDDLLAQLEAVAGTRVAIDPRQPDRAAFAA